MDISSTSAVELSIQAVSPLSGTAVAAHAAVGPSSASVTVASRRMIREVFRAVCMFSPGRRSGHPVLPHISLFGQRTSAAGKPPKLHVLASGAFRVQILCHG